MNKPKPANFLAAESGASRYVENSNPETSNPELLTCGVYELTGEVTTGARGHPDEEDWAGDKNKDFMTGKVDKLTT